MNPSMTVAAIALLTIFWAVGAYRRLSRQRKRCKAAFVQVEAQARRRHELIPGLVETARAYLPEESDALAAVLAADNEAVAASARAARGAFEGDIMARMVQAEIALADALGGVRALGQRHAGLAADPVMLQLMEELSAVESKRVFVAQVYNEAASQYNAARAQFPGSLIAFVFAFTPVALMQPAPHS